MVVDKQLLNLSNPLKECSSNVLQHSLHYVHLFVQLFAYQTRFYLVCVLHFVTIPCISIFNGLPAGVTV